MTQPLEQEIHVLFHRLAVQPAIHEILIAQFHYVLGPDLEGTATAGHTDCSLTIEGLLVKQQLFPEAQAQVAALVELLHSVVPEVVESQLAVHDEVDVGDSSVLLE